MNTGCATARREDRAHVLRVNVGDWEAVCTKPVNDNRNVTKDLWVAARVPVAEGVPILREVCRRAGPK